MNTSKLHSSDYYPFGMGIKEREYVAVSAAGGKDSAFSYRFGFNGYENEPAIAGQGSVVDFGARIYDSRLGRFLSRDPLAMQFPFQSDYIISGNSPIQYSDEAGQYKKITVTKYYYNEDLGCYEVKKWSDVFKQTAFATVDIEVHNQKALVLGDINYYTDESKYDSESKAYSAEMMKMEIKATMEQSPVKGQGFKSRYPTNVNVTFVNDDGGPEIEFVESAKDLNTKGRKRDDLIVIGSQNLVDESLPILGKIIGMEAAAYNAKGLMLINFSHSYLGSKREGNILNSGRTLSHEFIHNSAGHEDDHSNIMDGSGDGSGTNITEFQQRNFKNMPKTRNYNRPLKRILRKAKKLDQKRNKYYELDD